MRGPHGTGGVADAGPASRRTPRDGGESGRAWPIGHARRAPCWAAAGIREKKRIVQAQTSRTRLERWLVPIRLVLGPEVTARAWEAGRSTPLQLAEAPEAAFVKQISREMSYPARPLPVLPQASAAVVTAQMEASQQVAFERHSVSQAVDTFMATARMAIGR